MTIDWGAILTLIVSGLAGGGFVGWYTSRSVVAKNLSEAAGKLVDSYGKRLVDVEHDLSSVEHEQRRDRRYIRYLLDGIKVLIAQIDELGELPAWQPQDIDIICPPEGE